MKVPLSGFEPIVECYRLGEEYFCFFRDMGARIWWVFVNSRHLGIPQCNGKGGTRSPKFSRRYFSTSKISKIQVCGDEPPILNDIRVFYKRICEVKKILQTLVSPYFASEPYSMTSAVSVHMPSIPEREVRDGRARTSIDVQISKIQVCGDEPPILNDIRVFYKRICEVKRLV